MKDYADQSFLNHQGAQVEDRGGGALHSGAQILLTLAASALFTLLILVGLWGFLEVG